MGSKSEQRTRGKTIPVVTHLFKLYNYCILLRTTRRIQVSCQSFAKSTEIYKYFKFCSNLPSLFFNFTKHKLIVTRTKVSTSLHLISTPIALLEGLNFNRCNCQLNLLPRALPLGSMPRSDSSLSGDWGNLLRLRLNCCVCLCTSYFTSSPQGTVVQLTLSLSLPFLLAVIYYNEITR